MFDWKCQFLFDIEGNYIDTTFAFFSNKDYADTQAMPIVYSFLNSIGVPYNSDKEYQKKIIEGFANLILSVGKAVILSQVESHNDNNEDMYQ